jgi:hypothetical protein
MVVVIVADGVDVSGDAVRLGGGWPYPGTVQAAPYQARDPALAFGGHRVSVCFTHGTARYAGK